MIKYVCMKPNVNIHWWGKSIFIFKDRNKYVKLSKIDAYIINYIEKINKTGINDGEKRKKNSFYLREIERFVNEYSDFLFMADKAVRILSITGKFNYYYPLELHVSVTSKCCQKCIHCYKEAEGRGEDIDYDALNNFLEKCNGYVPYLYLSGGEPTLNAHFSDLLKSFQSKYDITVLSSGIGVEKYIDMLKMANCTLVVTIFSSNRERHDIFTGRSGSYEEILLNVKVAIAKGIPVIITTFLCKDNCKDIITLIDDMLKIGVTGVNVGKISKMGRATGADYENNFSVEVKQEEEFINLISDYKQVNYLGLVEDAGYKSLPHGIWGCNAGSTLWSIDESGVLFPCAVSSAANLAFSHISGNVSFGSVERKRYIKKVKRILSVNNNGVLSCPLSKYCKSCE